MSRPVQEPIAFRGLLRGRLPPGTAATADGTPATDPNLATMPLPLGGVKGAGMSLVFELLTSVLVGAPILSAFHSGDPQGRVHRQNALLLAVDPAAFGAAADFGPALVDAFDPPGPQPHRGGYGHPPSEGPVWPSPLPQAR
jgi:LDH2 family malate/lactate/ureidoglycolate dehydrogenase